MGMNQLDRTISQALKTACRAALEVIFDAAVFEEHLALTIDGLLNVRALCNLAVVTYCLLVLFNVGLGRPARELKETMFLLA